MKKAIGLIAAMLVLMSVSVLAHDLCEDGFSVRSLDDNPKLSVNGHDDKGYGHLRYKVPIDSRHVWEIRAKLKQVDCSRHRMRYKAEYTVRNTLTRDVYRYTRYTTGYYYGGSTFYYDGMSVPVRRLR